MKTRYAWAVLALLFVTAAFGKEPDPTLKPMSRPCSPGAYQFDGQLGQWVWCASGEWKPLSDRVCSTDPPAGSCTSGNVCMTTGQKQYLCVNRAWARSNEDVEIVAADPSGSCTQTKPRFNRANGSTWTCPSGTWTNPTGLSATAGVTTLGPNGEWTFSATEQAYTGAEGNAEISGTKKVTIQADSNDNGNSSERQVDICTGGDEGDTSCYTWKPTPAHICAQGDVPIYDATGVDGFICGRIDGPSMVDGAVQSAGSLAADPGNCPEGQLASGVDQTGTAEGCTDTSTLAVQTATALAANGANCGAGEFAQGVDAGGAAEGCSVRTSVVVAGGAALVDAAFDNSAGSIAFAESGGAVTAHEAGIGGHQGAVRWSDSGSVTDGDTLCTSSGYQLCETVYKDVAGVLTSAACSDTLAVEFLAFCQN